MKRSEGRILTSHSGSMFPPPQDGAATSAAYFAATGTQTDQVAETVRAVVDKQVEVGLDIINNGDLNAGVTLRTIPSMFDGLEQRPPAGHDALKGVPDEDMETYAEYYEAHPVHALRPGPDRRHRPDRHAGARPAASGTSRRSRRRPRASDTRSSSTASSRRAG